LDVLHDDGVTTIDGVYEEFFDGASSSSLSRNSVTVSAMD
jgi:hypothetical protein